MNRTCDEVKSRLSSYIDSAINEDEAKGIEAHLAHCEDCRAEYEFLKAILTTAKTMPTLSVRRELHEKILSGVMAETEKNKQPKATKRSVWKMVSGFASAAAIIAVSIISLNSLPGHPEFTPKHVTEFTEPDKQSASQGLAETPDQTFSVNEGDSTLTPASNAEQEDVVFNSTQESEFSKKTEEKHTPAATSVLCDEETPAGTEPLNEPGLQGGENCTDTPQSSMTQPVITYYMTEESYSEALAILSAYEQSDTGYLVFKGNLATVISQLESLSGYLRQTGKETALDTASVLIVVMQEI